MKKYNINSSKQPSQKKKERKLPQNSNHPHKKYYTIISAV